jgi:hypothetical protein
MYDASPLLALGSSILHVLVLSFKISHRIASTVVASYNVMLLIRRDNSCIQIRL